MKDPKRPIIKKKLIKFWENLSPTSDVTTSLKDGHNVEIRGFGTISRKDNKEKFVRNPKTNEKLFKKKSYKLHFKIGKTLHKKFNSNLSND